MTSAAEALGMTLPGGLDPGRGLRAPPDGRGHRPARGLVWEDRTPDKILTREAFEDAAATVLALGGSTNALIHLIAMAGRAGVELTLDDFDAISRRVPVLANMRPSGTYLMEDFYYAGGLPALLGQLAKVPGALHPDRVHGGRRPVRRELVDAPVHNEDVIRGPGSALAAEGGVAVLRGNLAPRRRGDQAHRAPSRACSSTPAPPWSSTPTPNCSSGSTTRRLHSPPTRSWCCAAPGRSAARACPSTACCRSPTTCSAQGVTDMVRISDARMSGTSYGTCVLHVAPESHVGGPLALVRTGDLDHAGRRRPRADPGCPRRRTPAAARGWQPPAPRFERGYGALYSEHITQADQGCDFDFLARPGRNPEPDPR